MFLDSWLNCNYVSYIGNSGGLLAESVVAMTHDL